MKIKTLLLFFLVFVFSGISAKEKKEAIPEILSNLLVELRYGTIRYSKVYPWIKEPGNEYKQYGILISPRIILTQCDELIHAISIQGTYKNQKYDLTLKTVDTEANLCTLETTKQFDGYSLNIKEYPFGQDPKIKQTIKVYYYEEEQLRNMDFSVLEYTTTSDYGFTKLPVYTVSSSKSFDVGSLAFYNNEIVGFISYQTEKKNIFVPVSRIRTFIEDYLKNQYQGFVFSGLGLKPIPQELKKHYGISDTMDACFINEVFVGSGAKGILQEEDLLLEIDGITPNKNCSYIDPLLGLQSFELLFSRKIDGTYRRVGDIIKAKILRKKETLELDVPLKSLFNTKSQVERIPWKAFGMQPYIVQHGIVFVELSHSYLVERLGKNWRSKALELAYLYDTKKYYQNEKENDKIVLISEVLPDPINIGYQNILLKPVVKVNQKKLMNLKHLYEEIQMAKQSRKNILELELSDYKKIYIDLSKEKEHQDILIKFNIPQDHYIF